MIKTTLNWTIKNLKSMHDSKETLNFDHPIQRQSAQWTNLQQSLLVHSILANYPVPAVYVEKTDSAETDDKGKAIYKYSVLDGKQRMTTVFSFINGEYALNEETPAAEIEGETYTLAGRTFEELDEDVRQELLRFKFSIFAFEDATDDEIEEIFFRLNNSTPLSKPQKARPLMGTENARFINSILTGSFFTEKCNFSKLQLRKSDDMCTLLQSMMLLDHKYNNYEYTSISADEVMKYSAAIKGNYSEEQPAQGLMGLYGTEDDGRHIESGEIARHRQECRHHTEDGDFLLPLPDGQPYHEGCGLPHVVFWFLLFFFHIFLSCLLSRGICGCNGIVSQIPSIWCRGDEIAGWGDE